MIRVALIAHLSEVSGAGVALLAAAKGLRGSDMETTFVLPSEGPLGVRAREQGVEPIVVKNAEISMAGTSALGKIGLLFSRAKYVWRLSRFLRANADLACINSTASIFAGLAARLAGVPIVWRVHELIPPDAPRSVRLKLWFIEKVSRGLVYDSESGKKAFPAARVPRKLVALNGTDLESFTSAQRGGHWEEVIARGPNTRVITSNGMFPRKAPDLFLQAARMLVERLDQFDLRFVIIGEPAPEWKAFAQQLQEVAQAPPLQGRVIFAGAVKDMPALLASSDVYVSPARNEARPIALVEAMAAGVPVVATNVGDCALQLKNGDLGELVAPEDPAGLAQAVEKLLLHPDETKSKSDRARRQVIEDYGNSEFWQPLKTFLKDAASLS